MKVALGGASLSFSFNGMDRSPSPSQMLGFVYRITSAWRNAALPWLSIHHRLYARVAHIVRRENQGIRNLPCRGLSGANASWTAAAPRIHDIGAQSVGECLGEHRGSCPRIRSFRTCDPAHGAGFDHGIGFPCWIDKLGRRLLPPAGVLCLPWRLVW